MGALRQNAGGVHRPVAARWGSRGIAIGDRPWWNSARQFRSPKRLGSAAPRVAPSLPALGKADEGAASSGVGDWPAYWGRRPDFRRLCGQDWPTFCRSWAAPMPAWMPPGLWSRWRADCPCAGPMARCLGGHRGGERWAAGSFSRGGAQRRRRCSSGPADARLSRRSILGQTKPSPTHPDAFPASCSWLRPCCWPFATSPDGPGADAAFRRARPCHTPTAALEPGN